MRYKKCRNHGKYDLLHRKLMEEHIGRPLNLDECVHHINGDKLDNRLDNLQLMTISEHSRLTNAGNKLSESCKKKISLSLIGNQRRKGIPHTPETKAKISASLIGNQRRKGTNVSDETKAKISASIKELRKNKFWSSRKII
jgi:hypothetical protein